MTRLDLSEFSEPHSIARLIGAPPGYVCLLYTSDAADERSSVDLGGRRIIKKKNTEDSAVGRIRHKTTQDHTYHDTVQRRRLSLD